MSNLANLWWDEKKNSLHAFNPLRVQFVKDGLINAGVKLQNSDLPLKELKLAEIGCGGGILTEALAKLGAQVTGIDPSIELINIAQSHVKLNHDLSKRVNYINTTIEDFVQNEKETYDAVISSEVLEHVASPELFLKECTKIVKPGKSIFITTINKTLTSLLSTILLNEYILHNIPRGTHQWNKFISPQEVQRLLEKYDCQTKLIQGIRLNSFTKQWFITSKTSTFYALHAVKQKKIISM
ncbi:hypothetical protein PUN28_007457 [Cardiocondyla obscurior]